MYKNKKKKNHNPPELNIDFGDYPIEKNVM